MCPISLSLSRRSIDTALAEDENLISVGSYVCIVSHQHMSNDAANLNVSYEVDEKQFALVIGLYPMPCPYHIWKNSCCKNTSDKRR